MEENIDLILIILNFKRPRFDYKIQQIIKILCKVFPRNLSHHVGIVFTFYEHNQEIKNSKARGDPRVPRQKRYVPKIMDLISKETNEELFLNPPIFFVENIVNDNNTKEEIKILIKFAKTLYPIEEINRKCSFRYKETKEKFETDPPYEEKEGNRIVIVERTYVIIQFIDYNGKKTFSERRLYSEKRQYKEKLLAKLDEKKNKRIFE